MERPSAAALPRLQPGLLPYAFGRLAAEETWLIHDRPTLARHRVLDEKRLFARHCRAHGLPAVDSILELAPGETEQVDATMIPGGGDLFLKLSDEGCGVGALLLRWTGEGDFADPSGARWSRADIAAEMRRRAAANGVLLQRRLVSHPAIAAISGAGLSTMRLVTVRRPDGTIEPLLAVYRLSTGTMPIDSFRLGGVTAPIELATGRLSAAMSRRSLAPVERHPDTGHPIAGAVVPHWERVLDLVLRAHRSFPGLPTAGWDVPVLPEGPVLNEGNSCWCVELVQMPHRRPLGETIFPDCFAAWAGLDARA
ncbi:MAG: sugar-transfer associated ATP-grasp domain-containing protein [Dongiaceae bacterium]